MKISFIGIFFLLFLCCNFSACNDLVHADNQQKHIIEPLLSPPVIDVCADSVPECCGNLPFPFLFSQTEQSIIGAGCVDIKVIDSSIVVDLKYSTSDNFLGFDVYGDFNTCYLQIEVAEKLRLAQLFLKSQFPFYNLIVYDGARPRSVQYKMWNTLDIPYQERSKYLSNPAGGSLHNFGAAVDLSIINENGYELDMGTEYDFFGELAYPREEERMIQEGKLTHKQLLNRELLRSVMEQAGFSGITTEWWHFNSCCRKVAYSKYPIIE
ncbi:MAG: M15 family metallopeptidase [Bacteroidota bacterium]|nr:M15 family metallopeptidase [Bacteroidota bacterium]